MVFSRMRAIGSFFWPAFLVLFFLSSPSLTEGSEYYKGGMLGLEEGTFILRSRIYREKRQALLLASFPGGRTSSFSCFGRGIHFPPPRSSEDRFLFL